MQVTKYLLPLATLFFAASCSKTDAPKSSDEENCSVQRSAIDGQVIPGQYIVVHRSSPVMKKSSSAAIQEVSLDVLEENDIPTTKMKRSFGGDMAGFVANLTNEELHKLEADPSIEAIEQDRVIALSTCWTVVAPSLISWNINKVGYGNGAGKRAWIVDTGIDMDHPDLNVSTTLSKSFITGNSSPDDDNGHGTHVAGIIGAKNNNFGMLGVASDATLISLKVLDKDGVGTVSSIIQALSHINANAKAGDVVNLSLGEEEVSGLLDQQVQNTASRGILIAIAAGNDGKAANLYSPGRANAPNIFTVSAVDSLDRFASFSNYGNDVVDFAAPGVRIPSTFKDGLYARMSGTSMAAPHVAGLLLLNGTNISHSSYAINDPDGNGDPIARK